MKNKEEIVQAIKEVKPFEIKNLNVQNLLDYIEENGSIEIKIDKHNIDRFKEIIRNAVLEKIKEKEKEVPPKILKKIIELHPLYEYHLVKVGDLDLKLEDLLFITKIGNKIRSDYKFKIFSWIIAGICSIIFLIRLFLAIIK